MSNNTKSCFNCTHRRVCNPFTVMFKELPMNTTSPEYTVKFNNAYKAIAELCESFDERKEDVNAKT